MKKYIEIYATLDTGDSCGDFIESLQVAMVRAGGTFKSREELEETPIKEIAEALTRNSVAAVFLNKGVQ